MSTYTAPPIRVGQLHGAARAELVFGGVEQAGPSWEGRVFLNNPAADGGTDPSPEHGYAGSFHVYGYGDPAPPAIADAQERQPEGGPAVAPIEKRVRASDEVLRAALAAGDELTVTVVGVAADPGTAAPARPFETLEVVFDRASG